VYQLAATRSDNKLAIKQLLSNRSLGKRANQGPQPPATPLQYAPASGRLAPKSVASACAPPADLADAQASVVDYFDYYNHERLHFSFDYQTPYHTPQQLLQLSTLNSPA
jgi:hypothetical protein